MNIIDLTSEYHETYFKCLEGELSDMQESGNHKACWYHHYKDKGLRVKLALDNNQKKNKDGSAAVGGMIQYLPIEESFVDGQDLYFILCIWVHGYKTGVGNYQGKGMGQALLSAAEKDVKDLGAKGMAAWGIGLPFWMKASWFKKQGYKKADRDWLRVLLWKAFTNDASPPHWIKQKQAVPFTPGKVTVTAFINGWCSAQNIVFERTKRACAELGNQVEFEVIDTSDRETFLQWGISDGIFINGKAISFGPPLPYEKILRKITKQVRKITK